jgi:hypothetical protein
LALRIIRVFLQAYFHSSQGPLRIITAQQGRADLFTLQLIKVLLEVSRFD